MDNTLNVVVAANIPEDFLPQIATTDPRLRVKNAGPLFRIEREVEEHGGKATREQAKALKELDDIMREAEVIYTLQLPKDLARRSPRLKWVQFIRAGVESVREATNLSKNVLVTNGSGCHAVPIAEHVLGFMLMFVKQSRRSLDNQAARKWDRFFPGELAGKTVGIVGLGSIGSEVARIARATRMKVLATRRSVTKHESGDENAWGRMSIVDELYPVAELKAMLSACDFVVVSVPLTPETTGLIGEAELRAMKKSAYFINIARGRVVDQPALIKALKEGWIAGAGLDVADPEPLPPESELWDAPNTFITAHISGGTFGTGYRAMQLFCDNLKRYLAGEKLVNLVDRERGY